MAGINFQQSHLSNEQEFPRPFQLDRSFQNLLPQATFNYRFSRGENMRVIYRSETNAPSVSLLQDVINNPNTLSLRTGNPDLKQAYNQTLTLRYNKTNFKNAASFLVFLYGSYVRDSIGNATIRNGTVNGIELGN